jgi:hypothetical protein
MLGFEDNVTLDWSESPKHIEGKNEDQGREMKEERLFLFHPSSLLLPGSSISSSAA